jgi:hypothetical protein
MVLDAFRVSSGDIAIDPERAQESLDQLVSRATSSPEIFARDEAFHGTLQGSSLAILKFAPAQPWSPACLEAPIVDRFVIASVG